MHPQTLDQALLLRMKLKCPAIIYKKTGKILFWLLKNIDDNIIVRLQPPNPNPDQDKWLEDRWVNGKYVLTKHILLQGLYWWVCVLHCLNICLCWKQYPICPNMQSVYNCHPLLYNKLSNVIFDTCERMMQAAELGQKRTEKSVLKPVRNWECKCAVLCKYITWQSMYANMIQGLELELFMAAYKQNNRTK